MYIECYFPPVNICHLSSKIFVPKDDVYEYTKKLYEEGREAKSVLPTSELEAIEFFQWKAKMNNLGLVKRWIINQFIK